MAFFDRLYDYVKDRSLSWLKTPGPQEGDVKAYPFSPASDWQFRTYPGETIEKDGKTYIRVNWQDVGEQYLDETQVNTYLFARMVWDPAISAYKSDGKYYETEAEALGQTAKKSKKAAVDPPPVAEEPADSFTL